ncbi:MAG TPA: NADH-quinone oxidoreductase subunit K [Gaiellaceae bacterium]|jgi:multicomponent Na+:H+ antiporter subunit C|nr:NADH-quinone oxidoreductase subunit K [Gaiellaceae bacterium]
MNVLPYLLAAWIFLVGLYGIVSSKNLIHVVVCVSVCQSSTYVLLLAVGYRKHGTAPVFADVPTSRRVVDPVVQSLTLTDLVVAVAVSALLLSLALKVYDHHGSLDPAEVVELKG